MIVLDIYSTSSLLFFIPKCAFLEKVKYQISAESSYTVGQECKDVSGQYVHKKCARSHRGSVTGTMTVCGAYWLLGKHCRG